MKKSQIDAELIVAVVLVAPRHQMRVPEKWRSLMYHPAHDGEKSVKCRHDLACAKGPRD